MTDSPPSRRYWQQQTASLVWQVNFATWLARFAPAAFFVTSPFAIGWYALRRVEAPLALAGWGLSLALGLSAFACWWRARPFFFDAANARVLLEWQLRLDTALTVAAANLTPWPSISASGRRPVVQWRIRGVVGWLAAAVALLAVAITAPVPRDVNPTHVSGPSPALLQTEAMLSALKEMNVAEPQALEQMAARARELARRPPEEQFTHSALEAADALHNQTGAAAAELARNLDAASKALQAANDNADMTGAAGRLSAALSGLRDGALPANKDLLSKLPANGVDLRNLSPEQRAQMAKQLSQASKGVAGAAGMNARMAEPDPNAKGGGQGVGSGGPGGGGESAPLALSENASDAGPGKRQDLAPGSLEHIALGDKLGTTAGAHDVDPTKLQGPTSAGSVAAPASGGDAAWVNRLTPAERATLKNFFK